MKKPKPLAKNVAVPLPWYLVFDALIRKHSVLGSVTRTLSHIPEERRDSTLIKALDTYDMLRFHHKLPSPVDKVDRDRIAYWAAKVRVYLGRRYPRDMEPSFLLARFYMDDKGLIREAESPEGLTPMTFEKAVEGASLFTLENWVKEPSSEERGSSFMFLMPA